MNIKKVTFTIAVVLFSYAAQAQMYNYYQIFMYNFTRYIQWPADKQNGDFVIGVLGNSEVTPRLEKMANSKKVGSQAIKVKEFKSVNDINSCHMIFIPSNKSGELNVVKNKLKGNSTLIITEKEGLGKEGSAINFIVKDGKLRFELNKAATEKAQLKVSGDLAKLAILI